MNIEAPIPRRALVWLIGSLLLVLLAHTLRQPVWVSAGFLLLAAWRALHAWRGVPLPERRHRTLWLLKHALAIAAFVAVYRSYGGVIGRDAGIALLILLIGLKLVEMRSLREYFLLAFLGFFLLVTAFFYSQSLPVALHALACTILLLGGLVALADRQGSFTTAACVRLAAVLILHAAPLMLVAFILFPRPAAPLWQLPRDARNAVSGLSEEMSPGNLSDLTLTDTVAFRATFAAARPAPSELYWRGPVMVITDGRRWTPGPASNQLPPTITARGTRYAYSITLEPNNQPWLFVLEHPSALPQYSRLSRDLRVLVPRPVNERMRYSAESYTHTTVTEAGWDELRAALQLPPVAHPRARALARQWRRDARTDEAIVQRALAWFRNEPFFYTLSPPEIAADSVDGFLFETRQGFCEHYAAAFAVLMRAAGIPARIVTGYQGGEYNPVGDYLIVRQRDAHAWAEIWLGRRGWVRVDPTAAVSPARVQRGIDQALSARAVGAEDAQMRAGASAMWSRLRHVHDAINNRWNLWVIGYNARRQMALFDGLGLEINRRVLAAGLMASVTLTIALTALLMLRAARAHPDPLRRAYDQFCRKLARRGHARKPHEGPQDYARRISTTLPRAAAEVIRISELYAHARYARGEAEASIGVLTRAVRHFSP